MKMNFKITGSLCSARTAFLSTCKNNSMCSTPSSMLYSISGCVPYISNDLLYLIPNLPGIIEAPLSSLIEDFCVLNEEKKSFCEFISLEGFLTFLTINDLLKKKNQGLNESKSIAVWNKNGKRLVDSKLYNQFISNIRFDLVECLNDIDGSIKNTQKKIQKSLARNIFFAAELFRVKENLLKETEVLVPFPSDYDSITTKRYFDHIEDAKHDFKGLVYKTLVEDSKFKNDDYELKKKTLGSFKVLLVEASPEIVLKGVEEGFDFFSGVYPYLITSKSEALTFDFIFNSEITQDDSEEPKPKKIKKSSNYLINILDEECRNDLNPIKLDCKCYTCKNYTKSYINHLLSNKELVGNTLLMIHNLSHYFYFFNEIKNSILNNNFQEYKKFVLAQTQNQY